MKAQLARTAKFLRRLLLSVPALVVAGVLATYLLGGFLLVPAVVKWQLEKQVRERLAHEITVTQVRFNPLKLTVEVNEVELRDTAGGKLVSFQRLFADFEWRSIIDRAWTFSTVELERPALHIEFDKEGRLNFMALMEALQDPSQNEDGPPPRLLVRRLAIHGGRAQFADRRLAEPLVTRAVPVDFEFADLSTLPEAASPYRLSARTAAGATVRWSGVLRLNPLGFDGKLAVNGLPVQTVARALHEHISIGAPAGKIDFAADYRFVTEAGTLAGSVDRVTLGVAGLSVSEPDGGSPLLGLDSIALSDAQLDLGKREIVVPQLAVANGRVALRLDQQGKADWLKLLAARAHKPEGKPAAAGKPDAPDAPWTLVFKSIELAEVAVSLVDDARGSNAQIAGVQSRFSGTVVTGPGDTRIALDRMKLSVSGATLASGDDRVLVPEAAIESGALSLATAGGRAEIRIERPQGSVAKVSIKQGAIGIESGAWSFGGQRLTVASIAGGLDLVVDAPKFGADAVALKQGSDGVRLQRAAFDGKRLTLANDRGALRVGSDAVRLAITEVMAERDENSAQAGSVSLEGQNITLTRGGATADPTRIEAAAQGAGMTLAGLVVNTKKGAKNPVLRVKGGRSAAERLTLSLLQDGAIVAGDGLSADLSGVVLHDPSTAEEFAQMGRAQFAGGVVRTRERTLSADNLLISDGGARVALDARGRLNWARLAPGTAPARDTKGAAPGSPGWRFAAKTAALKNFGVVYTDARYQPAAGITVHGIEARLDGADSGSDAAATLVLQAKVKQGGEFAIDGRLDPRNGHSDVKVKISGLNLAPAQPYLAEVANLALATGLLTAEGRLRYGDGTAGAQLVYEGGAAIRQLLIEESDPRRPFVSWESVAADELTLAVNPNRLEILELRVNAPEGRLIIGEEQGANFSGVLKKRTDASGAEAAGAAPAPAEDPFPVSVARIRLERGVLEFADHSLEPRFGTRMHELKGVITGFGTASAARAKVQVDARVDKYGLAKIEGEINALHPGEHTEVDMTFRNLEMTALTPYVAKFAGYRVEDGKLAVDLKYRIREGALAGDNRIVLEKLKLGEKVDSPGALDLPLELAVALLRDGNGVIDVRLPVKGNLQDPQFDYGEIIGKAMGNLLGGIVTAPFRALAAIFGGDSEELDSIEFEPGVAALAPPERDKLETIARALKERPQLRLIVDPVFSPSEDLAALRSAALRREVVTRMGIKLAPDEDPGPVDTANARAQRALEAIFAQRYSGTLLEHLKVRQAEAAPDALHRVLLERLISEQPVAESALAELATRRGAAIMRELTVAGGIEPSRVSLGKAQEAKSSDGKSVTTQLALGTAP